MRPLLAVGGPALAFLVLLSLLFINLRPDLPGPAAASTGSAPPKPRYAVVLVLDGARPDEFNLAPMPHLRALMARGTTFTRAFVGQEPANTPPSHATIGTGVFPKRHGVEGFLWENPQTHQVDNPTETGAVISGALEAVLRDHHAPSLAGQIKKAHPGAKIESVSAHKCYASDAMGGPDADYVLCSLIYHNRWVAQAILNHRPPPGAINNHHWDVPVPPRTAGFGPAVQQWWKGKENRWDVAYALWAFRRVHYPRVMMINLPETDVLGHFAPNQNVMRYLMREFDGLLAQIESAYRKAGILDQTEFIITADHGMSPIHTFIPYGDLSHAVYNAGATLVYIEHDTAGLIGIKEDGKAPAVARNVFALGGKHIDATFYKVRSGHGFAYRLAASQPGLSPVLLRAYRSLADTMASDEGAGVFAAFAPHTSTRDFKAYGYQWRAGHLGPQWDDQHIPLIIAGPGVRRGVALTYPARLVDIAPTVEHLLGAKPAGDGLVLQGALEHPVSADMSQYRRRGDRLRPLVQALRRRSGY